MRPRRANKSVNAARERLLDVGIRLLARNGLTNVSLRQIAKAARVNTALTHYYFGSKTGYFDAVVARCLKPINDERLRQLDLAAKHAKSGRPALSDIIRAWAAPLLVREWTTHHPALVLRLYADIAAQTNPKIRKATDEYSREVIIRFVDAFKEALPRIDGDEAAFRFFFLVSVLRTSCSDPYFVEKITAGRWNVQNSRAFLDRLVHSLSQILKAKR